VPRRGAGQESAGQDFAGQDFAGQDFAGQEVGTVPDAVGPPPETREPPLWIAVLAILFAVAAPIILLSVSHMT